MTFLVIWTFVQGLYEWFHEALSPLGEHQTWAVLLIVALWFVMAFTRNVGYHARWLILIVIGGVQLVYFLTFQADAVWMFRFEEAGFWVWALSYIVLFYFGLKQIIYYFDLLDDGKYRSRTRYSFKRGLSGWAFLVFGGALSLWIWEWFLNVVIVVFVISQLWQWSDIIKRHKGFFRPSINFWFYFLGAMSTAVVGAYLLVSMVIAIFWILVGLLGLLVVLLVGIGAYAIIRRRKSSTDEEAEAVDVLEETND